MRDGEVEVLGVLAPDRLARKYAYQVLLLEEFRRAGCAIAFLSRAISDDPGDQLLLQIQGAVAEYERALLGERFRRGKLQKARAGQFIGVHAPYGYRRLLRCDGAAGRLVVDEAEAEVVHMLYGWLTEERLTVRQILKRLNAGPWLPRCGRRPWAAGTVHHILSDPVYVGTAYANRYEYVEASEPCGGREPGRGGKGCRRLRLRPQEQWIPIAVPALVDRAAAERAAAQLARNAALASRNGKKHDYLLRCLLTCGGCGLSMVGTTKLTPRGVRRYYRCGGKDCVRTSRTHPCPRANVDGEALERAVWGHVRGLLADPDRLAAQFRHFAADADQNASREQGPERQLLTRLDRLGRADARLLDAYQAEVISLEELTERRHQLAAQRRELECQFERQRDLRRQRTKARQLLADLTAFCERVRGRLDGASLAEKQAVLQLVVERVIVHEDSLEVRHVIPLRSPPPGRQVRPQAGGRLCSDRVDLVSDPRDVAFVAVAGFGVVGRADLLGRWRQLGRAPQTHVPVLRDILRRPDLAQDLHRRQLRQLRLLGSSVDRGEQLLAVGADRGGQVLARSLGFRQAVVLHRPAIPLIPDGRPIACSHSGATVATSFSAARIVSPTRSSRFSMRTAASTWVLSVRWRPRALTRPCSCRRCNRLSSRRRPASPVTRRMRNSLSTVWSKPGSVSARPSAYFQSIRPRTASAASRSDRFSMNCSTTASASRPGAAAGWPWLGNSAANWLS